MKTITLFKDDAFIIVNEGSRREKELLALGWHKDRIKPKAPKPAKEQAEAQPAKEQ